MPGRIVFGCIGKNLKLFREVHGWPNAELPELRDAAHHCRACKLCSRATQPAWGEGPPESSLVLVGEQPGDEEDLAGRPFAGPAGQLLNTASAAQAVLGRRVSIA